VTEHSHEPLDGREVGDEIREIFHEFMRLHFAGWAIEPGIELARPAEGGRPPRAERMLLVLRHGCGFTRWLDQEAYLAEVITGPVADHHRSGCTP